MSWRLRVFLGKKLGINKPRDSDYGSSGKQIKGPHIISALHRGGGAERILLKIVRRLKAKTGAYRDAFWRVFPA